MSNFLKENIIFFLFFGIYLLIGSVLLIVLSKGDAVLWINKNHNSLFDFLFKYGTRLAEEYGVIACFIILLFHRLDSTLIYLINVFAAVGVSSFLKQVVFSNYDRPAIMFQNIGDINFVEGVSVNLHHSFPSGHTMGAFAIFFTVSLMFRSNIVKVLCFIAALIVAVSRLYLVQHFLMDVYVGAILSVVICSAIYLLIKPQIEHKRWAGKSLLSIFKKNVEGTA